MIGKTSRGAALACALVAAVGCSEGESDLFPVGSGESSTVAQEHFLRRLHLDLTAAAPSDEQMASGKKRLAEQGNVPATRGEIAAELLESPQFAELFVSELENRVFAGQSLEDAYGFVCVTIRAVETQCNEGCDPADPCACACPQLTPLVAEREVLRGAPDALVAGTTGTMEVERLYGSSTIVQFLGGSVEGIADTLWQNFLGRPAEADEVRNARALILGSIVEGTPAGLLFHRHGATYEDLIDILFTSEPYRDAVVGGAFQRFLGRPARPAELIVFTPTATSAGDVRPVVQAIVSSGEYFGD
jgi:hypothetical protein